MKSPFVVNVKQGTARGFIRAVPLERRVKHIKRVADVGVSLRRTGLDRASPTL